MAGEKCGTGRHMATVADVPLLLFTVGEAMIRGFCASGISSADRLSASVRSSERQKKMTSLGVRVFQDATRGGAKELAANNDIIVLGVRLTALTRQHLILQLLAPGCHTPQPESLSHFTSRC